MSITIEQLEGQHVIILCSASKANSTQVCSKRLESVLNIYTDSENNNTDYNQSFRVIDNNNRSKYFGKNELQEALDYYNLIKLY